MFDINLLKITESKGFNTDEVIQLYRANSWSSAKKPGLLVKALKNSHSVILAHYDEKLIGLGNALSDGYLVVYYPHLLIHPDFQGKGVGSMIIKQFQRKYSGFHQQTLLADGRAIDFYEKCGFERAGETAPMWIYHGGEH